jgi:hypothetical protein
MEKGWAGIFMLILGLIIGGAIVASLYTGFEAKKQEKIKEISSFEECSKQFPVMESFPSQCNTPDGRHFVQSLATASSQLKN